MKLNLRPAEECTFDAVSLGEVMLRLDPGEGRIRTARSFRAWEGGGEYNVIRGLHKCFGMRTAVISERCDNSSSHTEALVKTTDNVIFSATFPCSKASCCTNSSFTWIKTKHYFT